jgi:hypothetical protein
MLPYRSVSPARLVDTGDTKDHKMQPTYRSQSGYRPTSLSEWPTIRPEFNCHIRVSRVSCQVDVRCDLSGVIHALQRGADRLGEVATEPLWASRFIERDEHAIAGSCKMEQNSKIGKL